MWGRGRGHIVSVSIFSRIKFILPKRLFRALQPPYHYILAFLAAAVYRFASRRLVVIGVTGTKGKTTTVELIRRILEAHGVKVASLSSLQFSIAGHTQPNSSGMTMPGRFFTQRFLREAVQAGCTHAVIEVTSQAVLQYRHRFITFRAAVLTNTAPEHLEAHGGFEPYLRSKLDLFWRLKPEAVAIINRDDAHASRFRAATRAAVATYGRTSIANRKEWPVRLLHETPEGIAFELNGDEMTSPLRGMFNAMNILAAVAVGLHLRVPVSSIAKALAGVEPIAGRMEVIQFNPFLVIVDYAHTPDSLAEVYGAARRLQGCCEGKLICVLGSAGGGRDRWKRPEMGRIAAEHCARVILTNEDPFDEDPEDIVAAISSGIGKKHARRVKVMLDRREAIAAAIRAAKASDVVVITGKGSEQWIREKNGKKIPWDDRKTIREELARKRKKSS